MAKFEGSSFISLKVTFFLKVPTTIFVNPGQCRCKSVKTENEIISSKSIFRTKFGQGVYLDIKNPSR